MTQTRLLTRKEAAKYMGVSVPLIDKLKAQGMLEFVRISEKAIRFDPVALDRYIEQRRERAQSGIKDE